MSRRIKPDRRNVLDRGTIIEITRVVEYPEVPEKLVACLIQTRNFLWRASRQLIEEDYRHDCNRDGMAFDLCWLGEELDDMLEMLRLIADKQVD